MSLYLIVYFLAGIVQDFLLTLNWRFVAKDKVWSASIYSFLTTIVSLLVLYNILTRMDSERSLIAIVIYALGIGTGTFLGMKVKHGFKD